MECKTCKYTDLECNEQCKEEITKFAECDADKIEIFAFGAEKIATVKDCRGCFGASFNDCEICDERGKGNESRID